MDEISVWFDPRHLFFKMSMNGTMDGRVGPWRDGWIEGEI